MKAIGQVALRISIMFFIRMYLESGIQLENTCLAPQRQHLSSPWVPFLLLKAELVNQLAVDMG